MVILTSTDTQQYHWSWDIIYLLGRTKLLRITLFQRIHSEKTNEDSAPFVVVCPLDRLSQQLHLADFLKDLAV